MQGLESLSFIGRAPSAEQLSVIAAEQKQLTSLVVALGPAQVRSACAFSRFSEWTVLMCATGSGPAPWPLPRATHLPHRFSRLKPVPHALPRSPHSSCQDTSAPSTDLAARCGVRMSALPAVCELQCLVRLDLQLADRDWTDFGAESHLRGLAGLTQLRELRLRNGAVGEGGHRCRRGARGSQATWCAGWAAEPQDILGD